MLLELALSAALLVAPQDSARVQASLSSQRISAGETAVLVISVDTDGAAPSEIPVPVLPPGLDLGPISDFSQLQVAFPGGRRRITRREIVLAARAPGSYRIPPITVEVGGRRYTTSELQLLVLPGGAGAPPPDAAEDGVQLRAWVRPDTVYAGEQVLYEVEALFPEHLRMRQARSPIFEPPASKGFWVHDLPDAVTVSLRIVGGSAVEVQNFRQVLFPLEAGDHQLPPARMQYELRQGFAFTPQRREVASQPVAVHVRPLPPAPPGFSGAVGSYRVSAELSAAEVRPGEPATFRFVVEGTGNVKGLPRPQLPAIEGADVYPAAEDTRLGFSDGAASGRKVMEWTVVPRERGEIEVPGLEYVWFDPGAGAYRSARTGPLRLAAVPDPAGGAGSGLAPLRGSPDVVPLGWTRAPWFAALQALPLVLVAGLLAAGRRRRRTTAAAAEPALARAAGLLHDPRACLDQIALHARGYDSPQARELLERVRAARYAPEPPSRAECEALLSAARRLGGGTTAAGHLLPLLLVAALALALQDGAAEFGAGVGAYARGEYDVAVQSFTARVRAEPRDAASWYNLGNALVGREQEGRAAWAWLRSLELRPRDPWARHNLAFGRAERALDDLAPAVPLSSDELRLLAAAAWWVLVLAGFRALRRRGAAATGLAVFAALMLAFAGSVLLAREWRAPRAVTLAATTLRSAPVLRADSLAQLPPAAPVILLERRGDWVLARSHDLREGWLERRALGGL